MAQAGHDHDHDHDDHDHDDHDHDHGHDDHDHDHGHDDHDHDDDGHDHSGGRFGWLRELLPFGHGHSHATEAKIDSALEGSERGIWAVKVSLVALGLTALFQVIIVLVSGSVALLADTIHNFSDALTAVPLWFAFILSRRAATRRYTYGFGRAEDIAGVAIVFMILLSAILAGYESYQKFIDPQPISNVAWVIVAAIVGFMGNEAVASFRIRIGREIGSAALIADGQHARIDGFTSLAVLVGAIGSIFGFTLIDPLIGLLITVVILVIVRDTAVSMWHRLMDAVDPAEVARIESSASKVAGVQAVQEVRARWVGHALSTELHIVVDEDLSTRESHLIAEEVRHALFHVQPRLALVTIHVDPCGHGGEDHHVATAHHMRQAAS
jgi:cation diffusion facilitator family transporter